VLRDDGSTRDDGIVRAQRRAHFSPTVIMLLALCLLLFVGPVLAMFFNAFQGGVPGAQSGWTLAGLTAGLGDPAMQMVLLSTVAYSAAVSAISTIAGIYFAWLYTRTNVFLRRLIPIIMVAIIATPSLFYAIAYDTLANERTGPLNLLLRLIFGVQLETGPLNAQSWVGIIFILSIKSTAFSFVLMVPAFLSMSRSLEEAAKMSGSGRARVLLGITVPVMMPSILGAAFLSFIHAIESFEVPLILGSPRGIKVLSTQVYSFLNGTAGPDYSSASALALPVVLLILLLLRWQKSILGERGFVTISGKGGGSSREELGRSVWVHSVAVGAFAVVGFVLPVVQIVASSMSAQLGSFLNFRFDQYQAVFNSKPIMDSVFNTWSLAAVGGLFIAVFCVLMAWIVTQSGSRAAEWASKSVWLGLALPGILLGVAIFSLIMFLPGARVIYGTIWLLFIGFFIAAVPIAMRSAEGPVKQIDKALYEASRVHGARPVRGWLGTIAPLLRPAIASSWFVAAVIIASNVAVPLLLSTPQTSVLAVQSLTLFREGYVQQACVVVVLNLAIWLGLYLLMLFFGALRRVLTARSESHGSTHPSERDHDVVAPELSEL